MDFVNTDVPAVWELFSLICSVPHPSHHEEALAKVLEERCRKQGFSVHRDAGGNLVIHDPAAESPSGGIPVILQAHLDMVAQKNSGIAHDFLQDPIRIGELADAPGWLGAEGTTLGADNGTGMAMALALLEERRPESGRLWCLFTTGEEDGMGGARAAGEGLPEHAFLENVEGETEWELTAGCAGSIRMLGRIESHVRPVGADAAFLELRLSGLAGGHSGMDIGTGRANAALSLVRILTLAAEASGVDLQLLALEGGTAANAIPREARAVIALDRSHKALFMSSIAEATDRIRSGMVTEDAQFTLTAAEPGMIHTDSGMDPAASLAALQLLASLPYGVQAMEAGLEGAVRTSINAGKLGLAIKDGSCRIEVLLMARSSVEGDLDGLSARIESMFSGGRGGTGTGFESLARSPAWTPDFGSPLLETAKVVYRELTGRQAVVGTTHGGLECGHFASRFPGWDMVSLGPTIRYPHSPSERVLIGSVGRSYRYLAALVARLARGGLVG